MNPYEFREGIKFLLYLTLVVFWALFAVWAVQVVFTWLFGIPFLGG